MSIFNRKKKQQQTAAADIMTANINTWTYRRIGKNVLQLDAIRAVVDAISRNVAKATLHAVSEKDGKRHVVNDDVDAVLQKPNEYMTQYEFLYKCTALYLTTNNLFIFPVYDDGGKLQALYPVNYQSVHIYKQAGILVVCFRLTYAQEYTCPYSDLIHIKNHYMTDDLLGENSEALAPVAELLSAQRQGIIEGIKNSALIRGILKATGVIKSSDMEKARAQFVADNLSVSNNGGVIAVDGKYDYTPIKQEPYTVNAEAMAEAKKMVCDYFGISEDFMTGKITADEYESVYETRLEPILIQFSQALSYGLYPRGSVVIVEAYTAKMKYQTLPQVVAVIQSTQQLGLFTRNEYRAMLDYEPLTDEQGGNEIMVAVNNYTAKGDEQ